MIIKKFQAHTETEAIMLAKEELGKDAIVMNIKTIAPKGVYKLFRKPTVEITAAVDENITYVKEKKQSEEKEKIPQKNLNIIYEDDNNKNFDEVVPVDGSSYLNKDVSSIELKLNNLQTMIEKQMSDSTLIKDKKDKKGDDGIEVSDNKNITCVQLIYNQMVENEVEECYANQVIGEIESKLRKDSPVDQILSSIYQKIILKLGQAQVLDIKQGQGRFVFFIGPTGVGKTTTIAKIATNLKLQQKYKVAMLAADTYRIAAVEQLRTYANILDIPLRVIYSEEEIQDVVAEFKDYDVILVDTAGRSHKNKAQREDIEKLIRKIPENKREIYLVLSATTKYRDLVNMTEAYSEIAEYRLIFTKLDETSAIGNIFNIKMLTGAPLSYATFGQNVPDDIGKINPQDIAKQLMGGND